ncbi:MBG domain-containing protein, partial [Hungatella hathewayi]|uniref:MBG domain-containing protein n=3 Tax=Hungatella TaxID=1649459 RepID=UPI000A983F19
DLVSSGAVVKEGDLGKVSYVRAAGDENKNNVGDEISLTAEYAKNPNYTVEILPGTLTITEAEGNRVSAEGREVTYDGNTYGLTSASAEKEGSKLLYSTNGTEYSETAPTFTEAGTHTVYVKATNPNYKETEAVSAAVVIRPRNVTITVNSASKTYGTKDPEFTGNYDDLVSSGAVVKEGDLGKVSYVRAAGDENKN